MDLDSAIKALQHRWPEAVIWVNPVFKPEDDGLLIVVFDVPVTEENQEFLDWTLFEHDIFVASEQYGFAKHTEDNDVLYREALQQTEGRL